ncbi:uncharacterized protein LOC144664433 isoform X2 [Oculina patagonica]
MAEKLFVLVVFLIVCLVWEGSASHDENSATKKLDELFEKIANGLAGNDECKSMDLPGDCSITADCLKITCSADFGGKTTTLTGTINRCDEPVTVTINVKIKGEDIDWTHVFTSGDELAVPGLGIDVKNIAKAGMFIRVTVEPEEDGMLTLKVTLEGGTKVGSVSFFPLKLELVKQELPISTDYCDFVRWWESRNTAERIVMILVFLLLALSIISGCCCCGCCCCSPCRKKRFW